MASDSNNLLDYVVRVEDVAAGLHSFSDAIPRHSPAITAVVSRLFAISSALKQLHEARGRRYGAEVYWIRDDLELVFASLRATLRAVLDMFKTSRPGEQDVAWEILNHHFEQDEGVDFSTRLAYYHEFLNLQLRILAGERVESSRTVRGRLKGLLDAQESGQSRQGRRRNIQSGYHTPRPPSRPRSRPQSRSARGRRVEPPISPTSFSVHSDDSWNQAYFGRPGVPPTVPEPPPLSPTYTSSSSQSMPSSHTSYSSNAPILMEPPIDHWARNVFNGRYPASEYALAAQSDDISSCHGDPEPLALEHLLQDGFQSVLELVFKYDGLGVRLYWRPEDLRARILILTKDSRNHQRLYTEPLTNLKLIRDGSCLQLCRAGDSRGGGAVTYHLWARLNFSIHERMVLFACSFSALKAQDRHPIAHPMLADSMELQSTAGEQLEFSGSTSDGGMRHALRLWRDRGSGCVRLEASALRGDKKDVPIWTAFVTKQLWDRDWPALRSDRRTVGVPLKPPPTVFLGYELPVDVRNGHWLLKFREDSDARNFIMIWAELCRTYGRD